MTRTKRIDTLLVLGVLAPLLFGFACQAPSEPPAPAAAPAVPSGPLQDVRLEIVGIGEIRGDVRVALFDGAESFEKQEPFAGSFAAVTGSEARLVFSVPPGTWGISGFHDLNGNGELDANLLGIPTEPFAFSNGAMGSFGPPTFDQIAFPVSDEPVALEIDFR